MPYELAKELKDAGFPQRFVMGNFYTEADLSYPEAQKEWVRFFFDERKRGTPETELELVKLISIPTLEELIEACKDHIESLETDGSKWFAFADMETDEDKHGKGSSPTEAVAHLWLALNSANRPASISS